MYLSAVYESRRDRVPFHGGPDSTHHPASRLRSEAEHPQGLALT